MEITITAVLALVSILITVHQMIRRRKIEEFQTRFKLMEHFYSNESIHRAFQVIDYGGRFLGEGFAGSERERDLDQLLLFFDYIERSRQDGALSRKVYESFEYFFNRLKDHEEVMGYLKFHRDIIVETTGTKSSPFAALLIKFEDEIKQTTNIDIYHDDEMIA